MTRFLLTFLFVICSFSNSSFAQVSDTTEWIITTKDGNIYKGKMLERNDSITVVSTTVGTITLTNPTIKSVERVSVSGAMWFEYPHATRYLFAPNSYGLRRGEGYYQNTWVLFNQASVGINKYVSMGIGTVPLFLFGADVTPVWITPKVSIPLIEQKFNVGAGSLLGTVVGDGSYFGVVYAVATYGSQFSNVTIGGGMMFAESEVSERPLINISGMKQLGKRSYLLSENYMYILDSSVAGVASLGFRFVGRGLSADFALLKPYSTEDEFNLIAIPWLSVTVPFRFIKH